MRGAGDCQWVRVDCSYGVLHRTLRRQKYLNYVRLPGMRGTWDWVRSRFPLRSSPLAYHLLLGYDLRTTILHCARTFYSIS